MRAYTFAGVDHDVRTELSRLLDDTLGPGTGGYLRPWMTVGDPVDSDVLLVGANAATPIAADAVDRDDYIQALLKGGAALRHLYDRVRGARGPSPTRRNIDRTTSILTAHGVRGVMETNVWALPTASLADLAKANPTIRRASQSVLTGLLSIVRPRAVVVHGAAATRGLSRLIGTDLPVATAGPVVTAVEPPVWSIPSLSPPAANKWLPVGWQAVEAMARAIG